MLLCAPVPHLLRASLPFFSSDSRVVAGRPRSGKGEGVPGETRGGLIVPGGGTGYRRSGVRASCLEEVNSELSVGARGGQRPLGEGRLGWGPGDILHAHPGILATCPRSAH